MTRKQALTYSLLYILLIIFGVFITFKFWWAHSATRFLSAAGIFLFGFGCLKISVIFTRLLIITDASFSLATIFSKKVHMAFSKKVSRNVYLKVNILFMCLFFVIAGTLIFFFMKYTDKHEAWQLKTFCEYQKIGIRKIKHIGKGNSKTTFFDIYHNSKKYSVSHSHIKNYKVGDSVYVIFSTKNPDILKWAAEYNE